jgi:hypothetical protein
LRLAPALIKIWAWLAAGNVSSARPVRVADVMSTRTFESANVTAYSPALATSELCENVSVRFHGAVPTSPTMGRIGTSPNCGQPTDAWVRLKPRIWLLS